MKILKNAKVPVKLVLLYVPGMVALVAFLGIFIYDTNFINHETKKAYYDETYVSTSLILNADRDYYQASVSELKLTGDSKLEDTEKQGLLDAYQEDSSQVEDRISQAVENIKGNDELYSKYQNENNGETMETLYAEFSANLQEWKDTYDISTGKGDMEAHLAAFDKARDNINSMTDLLEAYANEKADQISAQITRNTIELSALIAVFLILIGLLGISITKYLRKNIVETTKDMVLLSEKNLSEKPYFLDSKDELGVLSSSVSSVMRSLSEIVSLLNGTSSRLKEQSELMKMNSDEVTVSMNQIAETVGDIAGTAGQQATDAENAAKEFENLGEVISKNAQSTKHLGDANDQLKTVSQEGLNTITELTRLTEDNRKSFDLIFDTIRNTNESAGKIGAVSEAIASIAQQTNLLALNAAIEAARAGEAGKGFAVVADEIRNLAEQSAASTSSIHEILDILQKQITDASLQSDSVKQAVEVQSESVRETEARYRLIVQTLDEVNAEIKAIEAVSDEMEKSRSQVMDIITSLSAIAQENAASTEETSATTEEVLASMISINDIAEEVDQLSEQVTEVISEFKL